MGARFLVDTSGILAAVDRGEPAHARVRELLTNDQRPLWVTDLVLAETDFLILKRLGTKAEQDFVEQILEGIFQRVELTLGDFARAKEIIEQFSEHQLGLTDATSMALAERTKTSEIITLDYRHFSIFRDSRGQGLTLVP